MTRWLLDTNILSDLRRPKPEPKVLAFISGQPLDLLFVSTVTLAELRFGIELAPNASRRADLNIWLTHRVRPMFDQRVLPVSEDIMFKWRHPRRGWPQGWTRLFSTRSHHRCNCLASRTDACVA